jgi:glycosyltransferase involved in cell wall biosynthesis
MRQEILALNEDVPVSVIYNGLDPAPFRELDSDDTVAFQVRHRLPSRFLLAVGHFELRKNYLRLVEAMALLRKRGFDCPLVIVGNDNGERSNVERRITELDMNDRVHVLTGLSDFDVRCAYASCSLFIFPSSYEGFGIPILEAMAARRPLALSDLAVFREVSGGAAIFFQYDDIEAMADAIQRGLTSEEERRRCVQQGEARVVDFGFPALADQLATLYRSVA